MTTNGRLIGILFLAALVAAAATLFGVLAVPAEHHNAAAADHTGGHHHVAVAEHENGLSAPEVAGALFISLGATALVLLAGRTAPEGGNDVERTAAQQHRDRSELLPLGVALASAGAAVIHFAVTAQHFEEYWLFGSFFVGVALIQLACGFLLIVRRSPAVYLAAAVGNAAVAVMWLVSRTTGFPLGPDPGEAEAVGIADTVATVYEVLIAAGAILVLGEAVPPRRLVRFGSGAAVAALATTGFTTLSLLSLARL